MSNNSGEDLQVTVDKRTSKVEESEMSSAPEENPHGLVNKTDVKVDVDAERVGAGVKFTLAIDSHGNGDKIDLPRNSGPYSITFQLHPKSGLNIRFDASGPFFCDVASGSCPASLNTQQIMVDSCTSDKLVVVDWNYGAKQDLRYQLNFVDDEGNWMDPCDPIILNGGGIKVA